MMKMRGGFGVLRPSSSQWFEVVRHMVAAERQHREGVTPDLPDLATRGGGLLGPDGRRHEDTVRPVEGLNDERHRLRATSAE